ncbi:MAG: ATP-dependent zinc metalloprotease FtsH [Clostridiales bacterium]|nr:ATP-dependent zinc metalloprotease FtsH [Clostridiales bacterium]
MGNNKKKNYKSLAYLLIVIFLVCALFFVFSSESDDKNISYSTAQDILFEGYVEEIYVNNGTGYILLFESDDENVEHRSSLNAEQRKKFPSNYDYFFTYNNTTDDLQFIEDFKSAVNYANNTNETKLDNTYGVYSNRDITHLKGFDLTKCDYDKGNPTESFFESILPYIYIVLMIVLGVMIFRMFSGKGSGGNIFSKSRARVVEKSKVRFNDIAGSDEEKLETEEIVEFLKNPAKFKAMGARIPKGVLLVGPPGTGKTLLAKAVAGESNVPFFSISGSDFVELYVGVGASRVRDMFDTAKKNAPCIVFIDEIDAVGRQRGAGLGGGNDEREQTLNQLLVEMDGFESNDGIIVLAATNRADVLDPALMRPGRFDRQIYVNPPDVKGREGIIKIHAKNKPIDPEVDFKALARLTSGFTGADIENCLNEAAILAARNNHVTINMSDITEGINKVLMGPQKKSRLVTEKDRKITAYHEAGHAILAKCLDAGEDVHEVSIIPRGMAGGYTSTRPSDDDEHYSLSKLNARISMMMGGRIAEEIVFGDITAGASSDIKHATDIARRMVTEWGMSEKLGFINLGKGSEVFIGRDYQTQSVYSEQTAGVIDNEIKSLLDSNYKKAKKILTEKRDILDNLANLLLLEETIYQDEVDAIMRGEDYKEIAKRLDEKLRLRKEADDKHQKEQEVLQKAKMQELKEQTAEALYKAGVISESELNVIKDETELIKKESEKKLEEIKNSDNENITSGSDNKEEKVEKEAVKKKTTTRKSTTSKSTKGSAKKANNTKTDKKEDK